MGQGRNAVFLAQQGWDVTGFEPSAVGLKKAHEKVVETGVTIKTARVGAQYFDFGRDRWDLIVIIYPIEKVSVCRVAIPSGPEVWSLSKLHSWKPPLVSGTRTRTSYSRSSAGSES